MEQPDNTRRCPRCEAALPVAELLDGWCAACGVRLPDRWRDEAARAARLAQEESGPCFVCRKRLATARHEFIISSHVEVLIAVLGFIGASGPPRVLPMKAPCCPPCRWKERLWRVYSWLVTIMLLLGCGLMVLVCFGLIRWGEFLSGPLLLLVT